RSKRDWSSDVCSSDLLKALRAIGLSIDPANAATLDLLDHAASLYVAVASGQQSGDHNLLGPQGVPLWLNYFHNDNLTYAVNNWRSEERRVGKECRSER